MGSIFYPNVSIVDSFYQHGNALFYMNPLYRVIGANVHLIYHAGRLEQRIGRIKEQREKSRRERYKVRDDVVEISGIEPLTS